MSSKDFQPPRRLQDLPPPRVACGECAAPLATTAVECEGCGGLPEVIHDLAALSLASPDLRCLANQRRSLRAAPWGSGVWRFAELVAPDLATSALVSLPEGDTPLRRHESLEKFCGVKELHLKHEGHNPTGSFKDRGMTVAVSHAVRHGARLLACASTGNTSASLAAYAASCGLRPLVVVPAGGIALGKLAQALAYGARIVEIEGNFDQGLALLETIARRPGSPLALLNSVNPWRIEGQKTLVFELIHELGDQAIDWLVFPAGNLGNTSAFGKACRELTQLGWLSQPSPRLCAVQAEGASPFHRLWQARSADASRLLQPEPDPQTVASAIRIGNPRSWRKALREIEASRGTVTAVSDREILAAKQAIDAAGIGCEPASAASLAGIRRLVREGTIAPEARVVAVLTGHLLKDPDANLAHSAASERQQVEATEDALARLVDRCADST